MNDTVVLERIGRVAHLRLNRPRVLNAIDDATCKALTSHLETLEADPEVGAIVISGEGEKAFSAGADLTHMRGLVGAPLRRFIERTWIDFERLANSPLPTIAVLHGYVLGGGLELALACDMRIADESVQIGLPEMGLGSVPGSGALQRLPALVGAARTTEMMLLGRHVGAAEAASIGLVNRAVPTGRALSTAVEWAQQIATRPREAVRYAKVALRVGRHPELAATLHGLVSDLCHNEKNYHANTDAFRR